MCDIDSPLPDVKEAIFQFQKYVGHIEDQIKANQDAAKKKADEEAAAPIEAIAPVVAEEPKIENIGT